MLLVVIRTHNDICLSRYKCTLYEQLPWKHPCLWTHPYWLCVVHQSEAFTTTPFKRLKKSFFNADPRFIQNFCAKFYASKSTSLVCTLSANQKFSTPLLPPKVMYFRKSLITYFLPSKSYHPLPPLWMNFQKCFLSVHLSQQIVPSFELHKGEFSAHLCYIRHPFRLCVTFIKWIEKCSLNLCYFMIFQF